jgi:carbon-monoxide dehydrogenase medium subunit
MLPSPLALLAPTSVPEALSELATLDGETHLYAGGVELMMLLSAGAVSADYLIDVKRIPGLVGIEPEGASLRIGAATTHQVVADDPRVRARLPMLAAAEAALGNIRVRSTGTVGGNLSLRYSHSDLLPPLLAYEARVRVCDATGEHDVELVDFLASGGGERPTGHDLLRGTSERVGGRDALIIAVLVTPRGEGWREAYLRSDLLFRPPTFNVAATLRVQDDHVTAARVAAGCAPPHARRLRRLERALEGVAVAEAPALVAARPELSAGELRFETDLAGSAAYKAHLATVLVRRAIEQALGGER